MRKKIVSLLLAVVMLVSVFAVTASAAGLYSDTEGHWGEAAINRWSEEGIVVGFGDGTYKPDGQFTRAQSASVYTKLLKLTQKGDVSMYTDMIPGYWYTDDIACCVKRGILVGTSATTMSPNTYITREQFFTMFARSMGLKPEEKTEKFLADASDVSDYAIGFVNALTTRGYLEGVVTEKVNPKEFVDRAAAISVLNNAIAVYADDANATVNASDKGITLVVADGVTVNGNTQGLVVAVPTEEGKQTVTKVEGSKVTDALTVTTNTRVELVKGSDAADVVIEATAAGAEVVVEQGAKIDNITVNAENVKISGEGTVSTVAANANNATVETKGTAVTVAPGVTGVTAPNGTVTDQKEDTFESTIAPATNGTVTASPAAAKAGETVTLTATPATDYVVKSVTVTDKNGQAVQVTKNADGTYSFVMPEGGVNVAATFDKKEPTSTGGGGVVTTIPFKMELSGPTAGGTTETIQASTTITNTAARTVFGTAFNLTTQKKDASTPNEFATKFAGTGLSAKFAEIVLAANEAVNNASHDAWNNLVDSATVNTISGLSNSEFAAAFKALDSTLIGNGSWEITFNGYKLTITIGNPPA